MGPRLSAVAMGAVLVLASARAGASQVFPHVIQQYLGVTCPEPACTICHKTLSGGYGTVSTPFGQNMMMLGLSAESSAGLRSALDQERSSGADSDQDGDTDIAALVACRDPNQPAPVVDGGATDEGGRPIVRRSVNVLNDPTPEYGCAMGPSPDAGGSAVAVAVGGILVLSRRRSRRREA